MHRYADLRKNRQTSQLQGNLVISNRKKANRVQKSRREYPIGLWILIMVMFTVSGFYIRYQALYVEDSVFRDAYLLINEHFISKYPLPLPEIPSAKDNAKVLTPNNSAVNPTTPPTHTAPNTPESSTSVNTENDNPANNSTPAPSSYSQPQPITTSTTTPLQAQQNPVNPVSRTENQNTSPSPISSRPIPENTLNTKPNYPNQQGTYKQEKATANNLGSTSRIPSQPIYKKTFSYYHPIFNSKLTKVGFFVVNQKTEYQTQNLYQAIFKNIANFKSSNPKVKNFFDPRTQLNNAWIENDTLLLDFNSAFENSKYGYKGIEVKIQQILWTFFNYKGDDINRVSYISFLINGKRKDTIGGDGKNLKPFYSRKDLNSVITL